MESTSNKKPENDSDVGGAVPRPSLRKYEFDSLSPTEFEEFVFDLLSTVGFVNVDWRKGTPKDSSPADRGRDIEAQLLITDLDGHQRFERWFVDAKHHEKGVPPPPPRGPPRTCLLGSGRTAGCRLGRRLRLFVQPGQRLD